MTLSDIDRALIDEARAELADMPAPASMGAVGCVGAVVGVGVLAAWPGVLRAVPAASFFTPFVMLGAVVALVVGPAFALFGGQSGRNASRAALEAALRALEDANAARDTHLRAAVVLVSRAYLSVGPTTERMLEPGQARQRIGARMELVSSVERDLIERYGAYPVFDGETGEAEGEGGGVDRLAE